MRSRALKFKLLCGLQGCIPLDPTDLSEVSSTEEFINIIDKFRVGIRKFNDRNPMITWNPSPSLREDTTLNDIIHDIVNSRKFMNFPDVKSEDYDQVFELNFATETITLYSIKDASGIHYELGSMHINTMFSNWKDVFYPLAEFYITPFEDEDDAEIKIIAEEESLIDYMRPKMKTQLDDAEFDLWNMIMSAETNGDLLPEKAYAIINYSGTGDSGDIDQISLYENNEEGHRQHLGDITKFFDTETCGGIYSQVWKLIDTREPGFYNNDGGYGEILIGPTKFGWDHYNYITETDHSVDVYYDLEEDHKPLPSELAEAMSASVPETKPETTLLDIVADHSETVKSILKDLEDVVWAGTPTTSSEKPDFNQMPPEIPF